MPCVRPAWRLDIAENGAAGAVNHGDAVAMRDIDAMHAGIINDVIPAIRRAQRHSLADMIGGRGGLGDGSVESRRKRKSQTASASSSFAWLSVSPAGKGNPSRISGARLYFAKERKFRRASYRGPSRKAAWAPVLTAGKCRFFAHLLTERGGMACLGKYIKVAEGNHGQG